MLEIPTARWAACDAKRYVPDLPEKISMVTQVRVITSPIWCAPTTK
jgi:hypothetical protein